MTGQVVDLCVPVWGRSYVGRWLDRVLPSWLSQGNLPALAGSVDLRVVLLTRASDVEIIAAHPAGRKLAEICQIRFLDIEDLQAWDMSAVTLTLAYTRGAREAQRRAPGAVAAFLNADFILGDGSLRALGRAIEDDCDIVLAPSLRALQDGVLPRLPPVDETCAMTLPCDLLAGLALDHLHPTAAACFVDQAELTSRDAYEFYHKAGPGLVISRSMQLFPLAVRPAPDPILAEAFCDYGLFDLWAPNGRKTVLADSTRWFALELGAADQQAAFLASGPHDPAAIAARVAVWSTAPQRAQLDHLVTIRRDGAQAPPEHGSSAGLDAFVSEVTRRLPPPLPVRSHPYWTTGLRRWEEARPDPALPRPPEMGSLMPPPGVGGRIREAVRRVLYGRPGSRRAWQIDGKIERDLASLRADLAAGDAAVLDDDRLWLARHAGIAAGAAGRRPVRRVACIRLQDLATLAGIARAAADAERIDVIVTGQPGEEEDAFRMRVAAALPGWRIELTVVGRVADEARRADLEAVGRRIWTRHWAGLARLAPRVLAGVIKAWAAIASGRPARWGEGQAVWIIARRL